MVQVIIFYSMLPNGEMDEMSLHGGCDVLDEQEEKCSRVSKAGGRLRPLSLPWQSVAAARLWCLQRSRCARWPLRWSANFWLWNKPYHFLSPMRKKQTQELHDKWL